VPAGMAFSAVQAGSAGRPYEQTVRLSSGHQQYRQGRLGGAALHASTWVSEDNGLLYGTGRQERQAVQAVRADGSACSTCGQHEVHEHIRQLTNLSHDHTFLYCHQDTPALIEQKLVKLFLCPSLSVTSTSPSTP
jgi:hypothetical protein